MVRAVGPGAEDLETLYLGTNFADTCRMARSSVKIVWADPVLIPTSPAISLMVIRWSSITIQRAFAINSSFLLVDGLPDRGLLSTEVSPCLRRLYHSFICVNPMASSPKACWIFSIVCTCVSPSFWQNLMQYRCSMRSDMLRKDDITIIWRAYGVLDVWLVCTLTLLSSLETFIGGNWRALQLSKFPRMRRKGTVNYHEKELLNGKLFFLLWT